MCLTVDSYLNVEYQVRRLEFQQILRFGPSHVSTITSELQCHSIS